ncbi:MAG: lipid-binding SYLF domain-containing protein [candidate division NC10 bacterium]|nr:lipid-binding SYLF domain-containing protein [candidate division NC10 bacterium]
MRRNGEVLHLSRIGVWLAITLLAAAGLASGPTPAWADDVMDATQLVERARHTVDNFAADPNMEGLRDLVKRAKGVFIAPQVLRGAFIFGASGGSGVLLARDEKSGQWGGPTFHTMGEASFGLQIGGEASEIVLVAMTDRGVAALLSHSIKLGADANIAVGPIGAGASAATANLSADIISFSRSMGLYGGVSVQGAVVASREALNKAYYGKDVTSTDILIRRTVTNPHAAGLIEAVAKMAGGK